jgi:uncharacterized protein YvpB
MESKDFQPITNQFRHLLATIRLFGAVLVVLALILVSLAWVSPEREKPLAHNEPVTASVGPLMPQNLPIDLHVQLRELDIRLAEAIREAKNLANAGWHNDGGGWQYYFENGTQALGVVEIEGVSVTFDAEGNWVSSYLDVPYISQLPDMPSGCELVSVVMMLRHAGVEVSKQSAAARLPYAGNPNEGFTGSIYASASGVIWPPALLDLVNSYQIRAVDLTGKSWEEVRGFIDQGRPVCIWFTRQGFDHTVVLTGYSDTTVWVNDPLESKDTALTLDAFMSAWSQNGYRALSYL